MYLTREERALVIRALFSHVYACFCRGLSAVELRATLDEIHKLRSLSGLEPMTDTQIYNHSLTLFGV
jgi:hypothetical protein